MVIGDGVGAGGDGDWLVGTDGAGDSGVGGGEGHP